MANVAVEVRKIDTQENYADTFTKVLVSNDFHKLYQECMVNGKENSNTSYDNNAGRTTGIYPVILYFVQM